MKGREGKNASTHAKNTEEQSAVALNAYLKITKTWRLNTDQQIALLGYPARSTFFKWKNEGGSLPQDTMERISYVIGIYKALHILFPDAQVADTWVRKPNTAPIFNGQTALERMLAGRVSDLYVVRSYLDAQRGG